MDKVKVFETYNLYKSLKLHFKSFSYDFVKYNGKTLNNSNNISNYNKFVTKNTNIQSFNVLSQHEDVKGLLISNLCLKDKFITDIINSSGKTAYKNYLARKRTFSYQLKKQVGTFLKRGYNLESIENILDCYVREELEPEVASILIFRFNNKKPKKFNNPLHEELYVRLYKFHVFLSYDNHKIFEIIKELYSEMHG